MLEEVVFSSAEVSGVGRRRGPAVAVRLVVRGWRRGRVGGGGKLHHAARVHHAPRPSEFRSPARNGNANFKRARQSFGTLKLWAL